ncbi:MAG: DUF2314 domain-containing protein [Sphingomonas bacterium]
MREAAAHFLARLFLELAALLEQFDQRLLLGDVLEIGRDNRVECLLDQLPDPVCTDEVSEGDSISIDRDRVSDWLYVIDGKGTGGFTFKLMWKNFSAEEKALYGSQPPFIWLVNQFS